MRAAHQRSWQSCAAIAAVGVLAGCAAGALEPSIWPPPDFRCELEEVTLRDGALQVTRRVRFESSGVVVYGTAARSLVEPASKVALPVFDRLAVYQLVPACVRSLARRLQERGVTAIDTTQGERGAAGDTGLVLRWRAFGSERLLTVRGRVHGQMAQILRIVSSMLPDGERFAFVDADDRPVVSVLRGVPAPAVDIDGALQAHQALLQQYGADPAWMLDAYVLACRGGRREAAEALLQRWWRREELRAMAGSPPDSFPDAATSGLTVEILHRLLPPAGSD